MYIVFNALYYGRVTQLLYAIIARTAAKIVGCIKNIPTLSRVDLSTQCAAPLMRYSSLNINIRASVRVEKVSIGLRSRMSGLSPCLPFICDLQMEGAPLPAHWDFLP